MRPLPLEKCGGGAGGTGVLLAARPPERLTRRPEPEGLGPARPAGPPEMGLETCLKLVVSGTGQYRFSGVLCDEARPSKEFC